ncbi:MAG: glycosyltransferase family 2 protein [Treponemataceae bacterium]|nr:glycosyltransferase family 2 protein [Treponemataceae bacterium]
MKLDSLKISICIPTKQRVEILKKTILSMLKENVDTSLYEICISDNSPTDETKNMILECFSDKKNIIYKKTKCKGFYNSIEALKMGTGRFLKLHNDYSSFAGTFSDFVKENENISDDSVVSFTNGNLTESRNIRKFNSFDEFINFIHYYSTWSSAFSILRKDFYKLLEQNIEIDKMFPHTSLLFDLQNKKNYIVNDRKYFNNQDVEKKGGYNLPETFGSRYLSMAEVLKNKKYITTNTLKKIKFKILTFIADWYYKCKVYPNKYYFDYSGWQKIIESLYGKTGVSYIRFIYRKKILKFYLKKIIRK